MALKTYSFHRIPANVVHMLVREVKLHAKLAHRHVLALYAAFQV